jgi:hypothetical protein
MAEAHMDRSDSIRQPDIRDKKYNRTNPPELEGINPLKPDTFPRAEDDEETRAHSPEFHDVPDPGSNVGRNDAKR